MAQGGAPSLGEPPGDRLGFNAGERLQRPIPAEHNNGTVAEIGDILLSRRLKRDTEAQA
jgi:hypothetical protein